MEIRRLRNPTKKDTEFKYGGRVFVVKAGEEESFPEEIVKHYTMHISGGPLVDVTDEPAPKKEEKKSEPEKKA